MELVAWCLKSLAWTAALLVPGLVLAARVRFAEPSAPSDQAAREASRLLVALGWSFGVVPFLTFTICLFLRCHMAPWMVLAMAGLVTAATVAVDWATHRRAAGKDGSTPWTPRDLIANLPRVDPRVLAGALLVAGVWFVRYEASMPEVNSCLYESAARAVGRTDTVPSWAVGYYKLDTPEMTLLGSKTSHARLGNVAVVSGATLGFGGMSGRMMRLLCGLMAALGGWLVGWRLGGSARWGAVGLLMAGFNPYVLAIPKVDDNILALGFGASLVPFLVTPHRRWVLPGILAGLVVCMRHELVPAMSALIVAAALGPGRWRAVAGFATGFLLITLPENIHHFLMFGSIFQYEHNLDFPPMRHHLLGLPVDLRTTMNWPFIDQIVRTPHNPFPAFVMWPLFLADRMGLLLFLGMLSGAVAIAWTHRRDALVWGLWALPFMAGVAVQETWDFRNKMGVMVTISTAFVAWGVVGARLWMRRPIVMTLVLLGSALALRALVPMATSWRVPVDARYIEVKMPPGESPVLLDAEARRWTALGLLPDLTQLRPGRWLNPRGWLAEWRDEAVSLYPSPMGVRTTPPGWLSHEIPERGAPVTIELDLSNPLTQPEGIVRVTTEPPDIDLTTRDGAVWIPGIDAGWFPDPVDTYLMAGDHTSAILIGPLLPGTEEKSGTELEAWWGGIPNLFAPGRTPPFPLTPHPHVGTRVRVRLPSGGLLVTYVLNTRAYLVPMRLETSGVQVQGVFDYWGY